MKNLFHHENEALLHERYQPAYIDAFLESKHYPTQTIEEWTSAEGVNRFGGSQIYKVSVCVKEKCIRLTRVKKPLSINVCISGPSDNLFTVNCTKMDWHPKLSRAVKEACVAANIAKEQDSVTLSDVCGQPISSDMSAAALRNAGVIYPVINGIRSTRSPLVGAEIQALTPVSHQANHSGKLLNWSQNVCGKAAAVIASSVASSANATEVDQRLFSDETRKQLVQMIEKVSCLFVFLFLLTRAETQSIPEVAETFLDDGTQHGPVSQALAEKIMETVERVYQTRAKDVTDFFAHHAAIAAGIPQQAVSPQTSEKRSMFSQNAKTERVRLEQQGRQQAISSRIGILYPTQAALHRDILSPLVSGKGNLHEAIGHCLCSPEHKHRHKHQHAGGRVRARRGYGLVNESIGQTVASGATQPEVKVSTASKEKDHLAAFKHLLTDEDYIRAIAMKHALEGIPPSPGFESIECHHGQGYGYAHSHGRKREKIRRGIMTDKEVDFTVPRRPLVESSIPAPEPAASASAAAVERKMPALEVSAGASPVASIASQARRVPGLEAIVPENVASQVVQERRMPNLETTVNVAGRARIRHTESNSGSSSSSDLPSLAF